MIKKYQQITLRTADFLIVFLAGALLTNAQQTEIRYLSGTGNDDTVPWEFYCSAGMNSEKGELLILCSRVL